MLYANVGIPDWVMIPTSELGSVHKIGHVVSAWRDNINVEWFGADGNVHIGIYTILSHVIKEPTLGDWIEYAQGLGDIE